MTLNIFRPSSCRLLIPPLLLISISLLFLLNGCASRQDVIKLQYDLNSINRQVIKLKGDIKKDTDHLSNTLEDIENKIVGVEVRIAEVKGDVTESVRPVRKNQADTNARLDNLRVELQSLQGKIEEYQYLLDRQNKESTSLKNGYNLEMIHANEKLSELEKRLVLLEGFFITEGARSTGEKLPKDDKKKKTTERKDPTPDDLYNNAYNDFKKGNIKKARTGFQKYLRLFPDTDYSDNAQYWIGESFFLEKKYKEAILEFDKVIRKYTKGNKVPSALLKQGMAFYRLGDKTSARLLLEKIISDYPGSHQAKIAKTELNKLL